MTCLLERRLKIFSSPLQSKTLLRWLDEKIISRHRSNCSIHSELLWTLTTFEPFKSQSALFIKNLPLKRPLKPVSESTSDTRVSQLQSSQTCSTSYVLQWQQQHFEDYMQECCFDFLYYNKVLKAVISNLCRTSQSLNSIYFFFFVVFLLASDFPSYECESYPHYGKNKQSYDHFY